MPSGASRDIPSFTVMAAMGNEAEVMRWFKQEDTSDLDADQLAELCLKAGEIYDSRGNLDLAVECFQRSRTALSSLQTVGALLCVVWTHSCASACVAGAWLPPSPAEQLLLASPVW